MSTKHTSGPWFATSIENDGGYHTHISSPVAMGTGGICDLPMRQYGDLPPSLVDKQREANARLIAAAPEMYELLQWVAGMQTTDPWAVEQIEALTAKVEGR